MGKIHATVVALESQGIMFVGPSGSGKSDLALRFLDQGAQLVSDDYVIVANEGGHLIARPPGTIAGLMEVRGMGVVKTPYLPEISLSLRCDLMPASEMERLPDGPQLVEMEGVQLPRIYLDASSASAKARVRFALQHLDALLSGPDQKGILS
ncbi:hypothetical protein GUA87_04125 [Sneathiella sp. P13V-1]|uniref:HPr kinase/phosphorylase n=1 Tax=Sneathiella sp. P13V-1 TaxID=2697366 RepID=UPI00187B5B6E|nr:HPr kinase/phosphatase C-terminal domain-containing protein [Sneathiella sp. P13V-1]MBE7636018.1 hypothetical protein [Sneathiella sp. P13V-1]